MRFPDPLIPGVLVARYKRFFADVRLESGEIVTAHCPNPGSMLSVNAPGSDVWLSPARNPERKLRYTWEMVSAGGALVGINTQRPNRLIEEAIASGAVGELAGYDTGRREVRYGRNSRIDLLLEGAGRRPCYVEVKNVTMRRDPRAGAAAEFPDSVTARGAKHLAELSETAGQGARSVMLFLAQRADCARLALAADIDPAYAEAMARARAAGVEVLAYRCALGPEEITVVGSMALAF